MTEAFRFRQVPDAVLRAAKVKRTPELDVLLALLDDRDRQLEDFLNHLPTGGGGGGATAELFIADGSGAGTQTIPFGESNVVIALQNEARPQSWATAVTDPDFIGAWEVAPGHYVASLHLSYYGVPAASGEVTAHLQLPAGGSYGLPITMNVPDGVNDGFFQPTTAPFQTDFADWVYAEVSCPDATSDLYVNLQTTVLRILRVSD